MFSRLRRHMTYANVAATLAVVFAMSGGAYALSGNGHAPVVSASVSQAHAAKVKKRSKGATGAKGPAGPKGATGPTGAQGPAGAQGERGPAGEKGAAGGNGKEGAQGSEGPAGPQGVPGPAGASVTAKSFEGKLGKCENGGSEFKVGTGSATFACNGKSAGGTLEAGKVESGVWSMNISTASYFGMKEFGYPGFVSITFPVPLPAEDFNRVKVTYLKWRSETTKECPGAYEEAEPGTLCIYDELEYPLEGEENGIEFSDGKIFEATHEPGSGGGGYQAGAELTFFNKHAPEGFARGYWVLTPPEKA